MPLDYPGEIYYADAKSPMSVEAASAALATSVGNKVEELLAQSSRAVSTDRERDDMYPEPKNGNVVWRKDLGIEQRYFEAYSAQKNPGGRTPAGWYATVNTFVPILSNYPLPGTNGITLSNVFDTTFKNYLVLGEVDTAAGANLYGRLAVNGSATTATTYQRTRISGENAVVTSGTNINDNAFMVSASAAGTANKHAFKMTFTNPAHALNTRITSDYTATLMSTLACGGKASAIMQDTIQYDGFYFYATASQLMSGTVSVYGYN